MGRKVEYLPDGVRVKTASADISAAWDQVSTGVPSGYAVATAQHEGSINERDTEVSGFQSFGLFQVSRDEAAQAGMAGYFDNDNWIADLSGQVAIFSLISEERLAALKAACDKAGVQVTDDVWGFLAFGHNQGMAKATPSIVQHKCNWDDFKQTNAGTNWIAAMGKYGDDCIKLAKSSGVVLTVRETLTDIGLPITVGIPGAGNVDGLIVVGVAIGLLLLLTGVVKR